MMLKITNNQIEYPDSFVFIPSLNNWVTNPTKEQLKELGFEEYEQEPIFE